jgi:hypothetical protein
VGLGVLLSSVLFSCLLFQFLEFVNVNIVKHIFLFSGYIFSLIDAYVLFMYV